MTKEKTVIGRAERIAFPKLGLENIPVRIDTGAKTSSIWATQITETGSGLSFVAFGEKSPYYSGKNIICKSFDRVVVSSTIGISQERYKVKLSIVLKGRRINGSFTLANRSRQVYPVLVGRNILMKKFIVDVEAGEPLVEAERERSKKLQSRLKK